MMLQMTTSNAANKEGAYINTSLLALGTVVAKLSKGDASSHIPYRDSKLTRLLQGTFSGRCFHLHENVSELDSKQRCRTLLWYGDLV